MGKKNSKLWPQLAVEGLVTDVNFMRNGKRDEVGGEFVTRLISEVPRFSVFFAKAACRLQAFHLSDVHRTRIEIYKRNKRKRTNFIFHQIMDMKKKTNLAK